MKVSLQAARVNAKLTQSDVAKQLRKNKQTIVNWENEVSEIARQMDDEGGFIARGYWPYDSRRIDYDD